MALQTKLGLRMSKLTLPNTELSGMLEVVVAAAWPVCQKSPEYPVKETYFNFKRDLLTLRDLLPYFSAREQAQMRSLCAHSRPACACD